MVVEMLLSPLYIVVGERNAPIRQLENLISAVRIR